MTTERLTQIRTRVAEAVNEALQGEAAMRGISLAELVRQILVAHVGEPDGGPTLVGELTQSERKRLSDWLRAAAPGEPDKMKWRAIVDAYLRKNGHDLPPADDLVSWACAVHPLLTHTPTVTPPRWGDDL